MTDTKRYVFYDKEFLAMLAHDLKTPIKAQIRAMNLLYSGLCGEFSPEVKSLILNIIASNKYMQCLVDNVLNDYRISEGKLVLNKTENDFRRTIEEALCNIGILSEAKGQKVVINYNALNFMKRYDEIEIQRVIVNLLSNAVEYGKEDSTIEIFVSDKKEGLNFEVKSVIQKTNNKNTENKFNPLKAGCGLGFLICEQIIRLHDGTFKREITEDDKYKAGFSLP